MLFGDRALTGLTVSSTLRVAEVWKDLVQTGGASCSKFPKCAAGLFPLIQNAVHQFGALTRVDFAVHGGLYQRLVAADGQAVKGAEGEVSE